MRRGLRIRFKPTDAQKRKPQHRPPFVVSNHVPKVQSKPCLYLIPSKYLNILDVNSNPPNPPTKVYSLSQVTRSIRLALERATANKLWLVRAEIVQINGKLGQRTVYVDLVEESEGRQNAKMRGIIWASSGQRILEELGKEAHQILQPGSEVVFSARIEFHEVYGIALHIEKIELQFMLGELERRKQATIQRLKEAGALEMNRRVPLSQLPQRIALIGSKGTSGFRDFVTKTLGHPENFRIELQHYQSSVQGLSAAEELVGAIRSAESARPDLIVLVRGGGGKLDLDAYNDYEVCWTIAQSTVPVWTGIGHESDLVVADLVAQKAWKTPTDVAVGLTDLFESASFDVEEAARELSRLSKAWLQSRRQEIESHWNTVRWVGKHAIGQHRQELQEAVNLIRLQGPAILARKRRALSEWRRSLNQIGHFHLEQSHTELRHIHGRLERSVGHRLETNRARLAHYARTLKAIGPEETLNRGFMILERDGKPVMRVHGIKPGEKLQVQAHDGRLDITVNSATSNPDPS